MQGMCMLCCHADPSRCLTETLTGCALIHLNLCCADLCDVQRDQLPGRGAAAARGQAPAAALRRHLQRRPGLHQLAACSQVRPLHASLLVHPACSDKVLLGIALPVPTDQICAASSECATLAGYVTSASNSDLSCRPRQLQLHQQDLCGSPADVHLF